MNIRRRLTDEEFQALRQYWWMTLLFKLGVHRTDMKKCPDCKSEFPATPEFFQRDKHQPCGLFVYCKECASVKRRAKYWKDPEKWREKARDYAAYCRAFS